MIRNIVFDMGEVLLRFDRDVFLDRYGVTGEDRKLLMREVYLSLEWSRMDRGSLTDEEAAELICKRVPERLHDTVRKLVGMWDRPILPIDGMYELVEELKGLGYRIYLLSNASIRQPDYWVKLPASKFFDGTMVSAYEHLVKPQPEIYRRLCERFSILPEESVFIDDATPNVEGAFFCGFHALVFHGDAGEMREKLRALGVPVRV